MRKVATAAVVTGVAALGTVGIAEAVVNGSADINQTNTYKIVGSKGSKSKPKSVQLKTDIETTAKNPSNLGAFANSRTVLSFDKNLKFNPSKFPSCTEAQAQPGSVAAACAKAKVGTGSASASAGPAGPQQIKLTSKVVYYNGPKSTLIIALSDPTGLSNGTIVGKLKNAGGSFGKKLDVVIPGKYQRNLGLTVTLTSFIANIKKTAKGVGYVESVGCTGGKYKFKGEYTYVQPQDPTNANSPLIPAGKQTIAATSKC